ncbi:ABC-F family ATP-binding cassette domain-containing protein [Listeria cossartiae subsp. cayugensis]|uniref:ABC-F family ATP-binding cassette domain-containing protein n=1 Tax=Listeria cossartiae TaxID=2838249 RepID=UPI0028807773|nr:ABC-F family ATP-binding cassette domain-containing protein [Listeria cossartiae]MDT0000380.1 ABC-F family ATP-binding cassette domain-containing protein [Listeria cossartiae subsp. cayugensis]MDT0008532.1 ABC-F family ATP-binding cassette domain-containing protein [Listeria cossartiae subsp. cayugensis]MDT0030364.1 ABC-F family ATP-binding cassette domain-containing protein [Listeria cossartiae subsp. cayugensis]MDT0038526.1 ABC-F family ATP-binding cassette domain-containing protein [Liste
MILLQVQQISKFFGAEVILDNIKLEVKTGDRIALVGRNGAGKSTLLKIIAGKMSYDGGTISKPKSVEIGYLAQNTGLESSKTIWDEMLSVFDSLRKMEADLRKMELRLGEPELYNDPEKYQALMTDYDTLQHTFKEIGGYTYEAEIRSVLNGLRFYPDDYEVEIASLSGGQKTRLALAKLLLAKQDILVLDEPTNHLDIETLAWLETYLQNYHGSLLIVSHDRYFLDKVVNQVYEISRTKIDHYKGNYSSFVSQKQAKLEQMWKEFDKQQKQIAKLEDFVARNIVRASTTKRAQSRRKQLEKMDVLGRPQGDEKAAHFGFQFEKQTGKDVLMVDQLSIGYAKDKRIASNLTFEMKRQDSLALVGPNGIGKSTLLKTLIRDIPALSGEFHFGAGVKIGYYDQEQAKLTSNKTVLMELWDDYPELNEVNVRTTLGNFLFSDDDVLKNVQSLSGGEKARLALAKLTLLEANVLILDEPTNHLDIESKEVLEAALIDFEGTILFVSHDRYFINRIASKIVELAPEKATVFLGDYDYYQEKLAEAKELARLDAEDRRKKGEQVEATASVRKLNYQEEKEQQKLLRQRKRKLEEVEQAMEETDEKIAELELQLTKPEVFQDHEKALEITQELDAVKADGERLMEEWETISEELESM